jgi:hypothetical protein
LRDVVKFSKRKDYKANYLLPLGMQFMIERCIGEGAFASGLFLSVCLVFFDFCVGFRFCFR